MLHHRIYLAGPMTGLTLDAANLGWRTEFQDQMINAALANECGDKDHCFDLYTPLRGHEHLPGDTVLDGSYTTDVLTSQSGMFYRDRNDVRQAEVMIACFLEEMGMSGGTCMEMGWADAFQVPVVMIARPDSPHRTHPLLAHAATYVVDDVVDAVRVVRSIVLP